MIISNRADIDNIGVSCGMVTTANTNVVPIYLTQYNEQTGNARRSIASTSASDTLTGAGARTVTIVYYDQSYNGPFFETVNLNGTTAVNTVNTNICFIERMLVSSAGGNTTNVGSIVLYASTGGTGVAVATISAGISMTKYAHHYVANNLWCNITNIACGTNGTVAGNGAQFWLTMRSGNIVYQHCSPLITIIGAVAMQQFNVNGCAYIKGPAYINAWARPLSSSTITSSLFFNYEES